MKVRCPKCGVFRGAAHRCPTPYPRTGSANPNWAGGRATHPLYAIYKDMIARCTRKTHTRFEDYGGRGIRVCKRWLNSFEAFVADMGKRPKGFVLDRKNNDGPYAPRNCRWVTYSESNRNRRPTHLGRIRNTKGQFT